MALNLSITYTDIKRIEVERFSDGSVLLWFWSSGEGAMQMITVSGPQPVVIDVDDHMAEKEASQ